MNLVKKYFKTGKLYKIKCPTCSTVLDRDVYSELFCIDEEPPNILSFGWDEKADQCPNCLYKTTGTIVGGLFSL